jgi:hypothetical protein
MKRSTGVLGFVTLAVGLGCSGAITSDASGIFNGSVRIPV